MSAWVATEIMTAPNEKYRALTIKKMISLAQKCYNLNNFNTSGTLLLILLIGLVEICAGLNFSCVSRLKRTWKNVPRKFREIFDRLTELFSPENNYVNYRSILQKKSPPINPYLGKKIYPLLIYF